VTGTSPPEGWSIGGFHTSVGLAPAFREAVMRNPLLPPGAEPGDEPLGNSSDNPCFGDILRRRLGRREALVGGLASAVPLFFRGRVDAAAPGGQAGARPLLGYTAVPPSRADLVTVPPGYRTQVLLPWGDPVDGEAPAFDPDGGGEDQARQVGSHHDGMHFFPLDGSSEEGLLAINHEYVEPRFLHGGSAAGQLLGVEDLPSDDGQRDPDAVLKELNGHGVSIVRIERGEDGAWQARRDARARRVTGLTPMEIAGPARGARQLRTLYSPEGTRSRGTLNNCAHGVTPWNTYLAAEENWAGYFVAKVKGEDSLPRELARYGVPRERSRYGWERAAGGADEYRRFDATPGEGSAEEDYRNEPNTFGWVVEIDPFDPDSIPVKRSALGRFAHEGVVFAPPREGSPVVCYSGDDARFEYIYKYVSRAPYRQSDADGSLLDDGTLYVARFEDDGSGEWLPLVHGEGPLTEANGFSDQGEVLVNTRSAADLLGATKMDRPEWGAVDPASGEVYFTLTNNSQRLEDQTDAANPRALNLHGHIIRWRENGDDHAATGFEWDLFVIAGDESESRTLDGSPLDEDNLFSCPDGLWFDPERRLWIQTDISESNMDRPEFAPFGNNQMLAADPVTGEIRRFLTGPQGQEITGITMTPDQRTLFLNVQHPGANTTAADFAAGGSTSRWPSGEGVPRSATVVVTREDSGVIGT